MTVGDARGGVVVRRGGGGRLGGAGQEGWEAGGGQETLGGHVWEQLMTYGRKLHAELGRLATRVKISEIRRCCTLVSW